MQKRPRAQTNPCDASSEEASEALPRKAQTNPVPGTHYKPKTRGFAWDNGHVSKAAQLSWRGLVFQVKKLSQAVDGSGQCQI